MEKKEHDPLSLKQILAKCRLSLEKAVKGLSQTMWTSSTLGRLAEMPHTTRYKKHAGNRANNTLNLVCTPSGVSENNAAPKLH